MKIFVLTTELSVKNGWGRYSLAMVSALSHNRFNVSIAISKNGASGSRTGAIKILAGDLQYKKNYFFAPWYAWRLRKYVKDCDAIHCFAEPYSYIAYWLSKLSGKKYFITAHGTHSILPYHKSFFTRYFHKNAFESADTVFCVSNYTKDMLAKFDLKNLTVINNGICFKDFYKSPASFDERENIILSVGALKHRKGQHISIEAFAEIAQKIEGLEYYIVGNQADVSYYKRLKQLAHSLGVADKIIFLPFVSDGELRVLYGRARVFVMTAMSDKTNFEGFGLVYLEANASGLPVIGSSDSGAEDAVVEGRTGFLLPPGDIKAISSKINSLLGDKTLWHEMSESGVAWAREHDWDKIIKKYVKIYETQ